ncbi:DNA-methyltransferase [Priestia aryabhattai]|uniref:DNA-methyltransferase n=1 Tax=Priestia aryabhattai TaxID=412384 RepID=UPI0015F76F57|nr:site-specific DNA-methyltransferase [Priestia aryabhattai]
MKELNKVYNGDCLELIKDLDDNSVDVIITDPPYELGSFRGEELKWEAKGNALSEIWQECSRVLKEGGLLLSFGANRTIHKIANKIEDAGFEIRDMLIWKYPQSIPRNMNLSKSIDATLLYGKSSTVYLKKVEQEYGGEEYQISGTNNTMFGDKVTYNRKVYTPVTDTAKEWEGWGTTLAPSYEPIVMARKKSSENNIANTVIKNGVGCLNIEKLKEEVGKFPSNVIEVQKEKRDKYNNHPTVKPLKLMEYLIKMTTKEGQVVLDPFGGSGSTGVAAKRLNRKYIMFELKENYYNIAEKRLEEIENVQMS